MPQCIAGTIDLISVRLDQLLQQRLQVRLFFYVYWPPKACVHQCCLPRREKLRYQDFIEHDKVCTQAEKKWQCPLCKDIFTKKKDELKDFAIDHMNRLHSSRRVDKLNLNAQQLLRAVTQQTLFIVGTSHLVSIQFEIDNVGSHPSLHRYIDSDYIAVLHIRVNALFEMCEVEVECRIVYPPDTRFSSLGHNIYEQGTIKASLDHPAEHVALYSVLLAINDLGASYTTQPNIDLKISTRPCS